MTAFFIGFIVIIGLLVFAFLALLFGLAHYTLTHGYREGWIDDPEDEE